MDLIHMYEDVISGKKNKFPDGVWIPKENRKIIIKYLLEEKLKWSRDDICANLQSRTFIENKLANMFNTYYRSAYKALDAVYPGEYKPWELANVPNSFWDKSTSVEAIIWFIEEKMKWSRDDVCEKICAQVLIKSRLGSMFTRFFDNNTYAALEAAYPGKYMPWDLKQASRSFFRSDEYINAIESIKHLVEEKLKWNHDDVCANLSVHTFRNNGLGDVLSTVFRSNVYVAINSAFPDKYKIWELKHLMRPSGFWTLEKGKEATKWLIEEKLKWSSSQVRRELVRKTFVDNGLGGMLSSCFRDNAYRALNATYPGQYQPGEIKYTRRGVLTADMCAEAIRSLIEDDLKWSRDDVCEKISTQVFLKSDISHTFIKLLRRSPHAALETAYPGEYKPWELKRVPHRFWNTETAIEATRWLIEEKLKWSREEVCELTRQSVFVDAGLGGMLSTCFAANPSVAITAAYPGEYKLWEFKKVPNNFWSLETSIEATKWLIEEKLRWTKEEVCIKLVGETFKENGLSGMLSSCFGNSTYSALEATYPGEYKAWELKRIPRGFWNMENAIKATKWLVEEKLGWTVAPSHKDVSIKDFSNHGLGGMLSTCFKSSSRKAINAAYPEKNTK